MMCSRARLFTQILADSCRGRESKAIGNAQDLLAGGPWNGREIHNSAGAGGPEPGFVSRDGNYFDNKSSAAAGVIVSRLPSARFLTSTLPSARPRGPTNT